jgi:leucyl/phenylalanyl-tRNA--protein transferase
MVHIPWLDENSVEFPSTKRALKDPNGLLAGGGDLSPSRLLNAYRHGIFPWYSEDQPLLWWSPNPRLVLYPHLIHISRSLHKLLKKNIFSITFDQCFETVMHNCAGMRRGEHHGTWITSEMMAAYQELHQLGYAHSIEVWNDNQLVGGLYGIALGKIFFGESMFSHQDNASKIALAYLCGQLNAWGYQLVDCQVESDHLLSMGAVNISRQEFEQQLREYTNIGAVNVSEKGTSEIGQWELTWRYPH